MTFDFDERTKKRRKKFSDSFIEAKNVVDGNRVGAIEHITFIRARKNESAEQ
jgi:hypothetical protein